MATYKGKETAVDMSAKEAYARLSDVNAFKEMLDTVPEDMRAGMGDVKFTEDSIIIGTPQVGDITLKLEERIEPSLIKFTALQSPVPLSMSIVINGKEDEEHCEVNAQIDIDIPAMLRPFIGGKMQDAANKFSELIATILNGRA